jgi:hypothetical protein
MLPRLLLAFLALASAAFGQVRGITANPATSALLWPSASSFRSQNGIAPLAGAALTSATVNGLTITSGSGATLTIADDKTFAVNSNLTLTSADGATLNIGTGAVLSALANNTSTSVVLSNVTLQLAGLGATPLDADQLSSGLIPAARFSSAVTPAWSSTMAYTAGQSVAGSDGNVYRALASTTNNDPTGDDGSHWQAARVLADVTLNVPSRFATFATAWAFLKAAAIARDATATIQFADGTYTMGSTRFSLNHPFGGQIRLLGNTTTLGNVVLDWSGASFAANGLSYAADNIGAMYVNHGHVSPRIDGFKVIGPGRTNATCGYGFEAFDNATLNFGPKMWVTDFYCAVATFFCSAAFCDYMHVANGADGNLFVYGSSSISFQGGLSEGAGSYYAMSGAIMEFSSSLFAPNATFQNNAGSQIALDYGSSAMVDGSTFVSAGAFDSAPAIKCLAGSMSVQRNGCTFTNCSGLDHQISQGTSASTDFPGQQIAFGLQTGFASFLPQFCFAEDAATVGMSLTQQNVATVAWGFNGTTTLLYGGDYTGIEWRTGTSGITGGTLMGSINAKGFTPVKLAADPGSPSEGALYYNTATHHWFGYNGTAFVQLDN